MHITTKEVRKVVDELDWLVKVYKKDNPDPERDWRTYEQQLARRVKYAMNWFEPLIDKAVSILKFVMQTMLEENQHSH